MINRRLFLNHLGRGAATIGAVSCINPAWAAADEAIGSKHITIGNSTALTGPLGNAGQEHSTAVRAAFAHRRKTLMNSLRDEGYQADRIARVMQAVDVAAQARAETLTLEQYHALAAAFHDEPV